MRFIGLALFTGLLIAFYSWGCGIWDTTWAHRLEILQDAQEYLQLAGLLVGRNIAVAKEVILLRPPLFPAFLSLSFWVGGGGVMFLQILMNLTSVIFLYLAIIRMTERPLFAW